MVESMSIGMHIPRIIIHMASGISAADVPEQDCRQVRKLCDLLFEPNDDDEGHIVGYR